MYFAIFCRMSSLQKKSTNYYAPGARVRVERDYSVEMYKRVFPNRN